MKPAIIINGVRLSEDQKLFLKRALLVVFNDNMKLIEKAKPGSDTFALRSWRDLAYRMMVAMEGSVPIRGNPDYTFQGQWDGEAEVKINDHLISSNYGIVIRMAMGITDTARKKAGNGIDPEVVRHLIQTVALSKSLKKK